MRKSVHNEIQTCISGTWAQYCPEARNQVSLPLSMGISIGRKINYHRSLPISTQPIPTSQVAALTWQQYESKQNKYKEIFLTLSIHVAVFCILLCMVKLVFCRGVATYCNTTMLCECEVECRRFEQGRRSRSGGRRTNIQPTNSRENAVWALVGRSI